MKNPDRLPQPLALVAALLVLASTACTTTINVAPTSAPAPAKSTATQPVIADPVGNLTGDATRRFMDIVATTVRAENGDYVLDVAVASPFPAAADMKGGKRFDFIWFIDIDRDRSTGQTPLGNDYNIHLFLDENGWSAAWQKVTPASSNDGIEIHPEELRIAVAGARATLAFPAHYLPRTSFDMWATCFSGNAKNWAPLTQNPPTPRATFNF